MMLSQDSSSEVICPPKPNRIRKVLLVEDNPTTQMIHEVMLIELGCCVDVVANGEDALAKIEKPYDLVLLDIELPGINGIEVAEKFRSHMKHQHTRMAAVTSLTDRMTSKSCMAAGIEQVLQKPLEQMTLKSLLYEAD